MNSSTIVDILSDIDHLRFGLEKLREIVIIQNQQITELQAAVQQLNAQ